MNLPKTIRTQSDDSRAQKHAVLPHNPKRHSASFRRVLVLVYGTVVLFALLITGIYTVVSPQIFASNKISDLIPKGQIIAGYIESTLRGELSSTYLVPLIGGHAGRHRAGPIPSEIRRHGRNPRHTAHDDSRTRAGHGVSLRVHRRGL